MNGLRSGLTVIIIGGIVLSLTKNLTQLPAVINSGASAFSMIYRTVSGTDNAQRPGK